MLSLGRWTFFRLTKSDMELLKLEEEKDLMLSKFDNVGRGKVVVG